jgi:hypothetical protein
VLKNGKGYEEIIVDEYPWEMPLGDDELMKRMISIEQKRAMPVYFIVKENALYL